VRITVAPGIDLDARAGATVKNVGAVAAREGAPLPDRPWCGDVRLDPEHPVGTWPLVDGARLAPERSTPCAPPRGVIARAIAGPDAGRWATLVDGTATIGRDDACSLRLDDPFLSRTHATVRDSSRVEDASTTNGTRRWRDGALRRGRRVADLRPGDVLDVGRSLVVIEDPEHPATARAEEVAASPRETVAKRLAPLAGSLAMGVMMAAVTGRWWILLIGMAYPAVAVGPALAASRRPTRRLDADAIPCPLPGSREFWSARRGTIAVVGEGPAARGVARAIVLTRGRAPAEGSWTERWMSWLPPATHEAAEVRIGGEAPSWAETVVRVDGAVASVECGGVARVAPAAVVSEDAAEAWARAIAGASSESALPSTVRLDDLDAPAEAPPRANGARRSIAAPIGAGPSGPLVLDLDAHGPHLLVAGTTGSGKSALLETLVLALADRYCPDDLAIALIDFKGGAGLGACMDLPHVAGTLTDLDAHLARRSLAALADEVAERKRRLRDAGHPSFHEWEASGDAPARLLVVIDEYQELVALYRDFLPDLARLAAQGRSLGLHLVLATQRPAGAVTPEVRANVGSTIALRVVSEAESRDLVGSRDAAEIPRDAPGRAILASGGERSVFQGALASATPAPIVQRLGSDPPEPDAAGLAARVRERWTPSRAPRLWLPPLPARLTARDGQDGSDGAVWLGRGDLPSQRTQPDCSWLPSSGPLVVAGPGGSGRTTALETVAAQAERCGLVPRWLPNDPREAARTIALVREADDALLLVDDAVRAFSALADVDRGQGQESLLDLLARAAPVVLALPLGAPQRLATHASVRVILSGGDPAEEALWSVPRALQALPRTPGRGVVGDGGAWMETQIAVLRAAPRATLVSPLPATVDPDDLPGTLVDGRVPVGVGGDAAVVVGIDPRRPILVVGDAPRERGLVEAALERLGRRCDVSLSVTTLDNALSRPRREIASSTVVIAAPTPRALSDVHPGDAPGLVDARPATGRVVVVADGVAFAAQLATG